MGPVSQTGKRTIQVWLGDLGLPSFSITPRPQCSRSFVITADLLRRRVEQNRALGAPGYVAQMTEQGAFLPLLNLGIERRTAADGIDKILKMCHIDGRALLGLNLDALEVIQGVVVPATNNEATAFAIDRHKRTLVLRTRVAGTAVP